MASQHVALSSTLNGFLYTSCNFSWNLSRLLRFSFTNHHRICSMSIYHHVASLLYVIMYWLFKYGTSSLTSTWDRLEIRRTPKPVNRTDLEKCPNRFDIIPDHQLFLTNGHILLFGIWEYCTFGEHCATRRTVSGSIPGDVTGHFFRSYRQNHVLWGRLSF